MSSFQDPAQYIDQMAQLLDLSLAADNRASVIENFAQLQAIAQLVLDFPLPQVIEVAPVFRP